MSNIKIKGDLVLELQQYSAEVERLTPKMLRAGIKPYEQEAKRNAARHSKSGELAKSIKASAPKKTRDGRHFIKVAASGYDAATNVPNPIKLIALEYGTSKQPATPILRPAMESKEGESNAAMESFLRKELGR